MSGGEFDYNCFKISQFAEELQHKIETNLNEFFQGSLMSIITLKNISWQRSVSGLVVRDKQILLVKQGKKKKHRLSGCWRLPTGRVLYEETLQDCCLRKVKKETGIEVIADQDYLDVKEIPFTPDPLREDNCPGLRVYFFKCLPKPKYSFIKPVPSPEADITEARYFPANMLAQVLSFASMTDLPEGVRDEIRKYW